MVAWGPIIGAGISAIGSLFGKDKEETTTTINYRAMARQAEKAGFNPLTAIRNGGSAGFTTTTHPGLSMMDRFGAAFQTIGNAIASYDARADERADLENQLLKQRLHRIQQQAGTDQERWSFDVPSAAGSTRSTKAATGGAGAGLAPDPGVNKLVNFPGGVAKPAFEPVTEYDELAVGVDQATSDVKRIWKNDPFHDWWKKVYTDGPRLPPWKPVPVYSTQPRRPISWTPGVNRHALGG